MGEKASSFLNNKSFHPGNAANRYKLFIAEEKKKNEDVKREELRREFEQQEVRRQTKSLVDGGGPGGMSFMYQLPPGYVEKDRMKPPKDSKDKTPAERDQERFGELVANAPREGSYTTSMEVSHKPFGVELRKTQCSKCGQWGHSKGDRECPMRNVVSASERERQSFEDPLARTAGAEASGAPLRWKPRAMPETGIHGGGTGGSSAADDNQQFVSMLGEEEMLAASVAAEADILSSMDPGMLAMLDEKQRRKLVKMYRKEMRGMGADEEEEEGEKKKRKKEGKKEKKEKHKKKHHKSSSSHKDKGDKSKRRKGEGSGSSSGSDSE